MYISIIVGSGSTIIYKSAHIKHHRYVDKKKTHIHLNIWVIGKYFLVIFLQKKKIKKYDICKRFT